MNDVLEWSSEYHVEVDKIDNWNDSPHSFDKKVVYFKPKKNNNGNFRFRFGIQMAPLNTNNNTIAIEMFL